MDTPPPEASMTYAILTVPYEFYADPYLPIDFSTDSLCSPNDSSFIPTSSFSSPIDQSSLLPMDSLIPMGYFSLTNDNTSLLQMDSLMPRTLSPFCLLILPLL
jgi:hypothetical protein